MRTKTKAKKVPAPKMNYDVLLPTEDEKNNAKVKLFSRISSVSDDEIGGPAIEQSKHYFDEAFMCPVVEVEDCVKKSSVPTLENIRADYNTALDLYKSLSTTEFDLGNIPQYTFNNILIGIRNRVNECHIQEAGDEIRSLFLQAKIKALNTVNTVVLKSFENSCFIEDYIFNDKALAREIVDNFRALLSDYLKKVVNYSTQAYIDMDDSKYYPSFMNNYYHSASPSLNTSIEDKIKFYKNNKFTQQDINDYNSLLMASENICGIVSAAALTQSLYYDIYNIITAISCGSNELILTLMGTLDASGVFVVYHDDIAAINEYVNELKVTINTAELSPSFTKYYNQTACDYEDDEDDW